MRTKSCRGTKITNASNAKREEIRNNEKVQAAMKIVSESRKRKNRTTQKGEDHKNEKKKSRLETRKQCIEMSTLDSDMINDPLGSNEYKF